MSVIKKVKCLIYFFTILSLLHAQRPSLVSPSHNLCTEPNGLNFTWDSYPGALSYELQISTNQSFSGATNYSAPSTSFSPTLMSGQVYYWRVRAVISSGFSDWSFPRTLYAYKPDDFNGCLLWCSALGLGLTNGQGVQNWISLSGSGQQLFQNNVSHQPIYFSTGGFRNLPRIHFPGTSRFFTSNITTALLPNNGPMHIFQFGKCYNQSLGFLYYLGNAEVYNSHYTARCGVTEANDGRYRALGYNGVLHAYTFDFFTPNSNFALISVIDYPGGNASLFRNGILQNSTSSNPVPIDPNATFKLGADEQGNLPGYFDVQEFLVYNQAITDTQRKIIEKFVLDKYAPPVNLGPDIISSGICTNTQLNAGNYYSTYLWNTGDATPTITATSLGTYWVQVTDPFGRISTDTVRVLPPFNFNQLQDGYICTGGSIVWDTNVPSGYNLTWSDGSTGQTITITQPGNYYVTVMDTLNCSFSSDTATLVADNFPLAGLGNNLTLCAGNFLSFDLPVGPGASFQWNNASTDTLLIVNNSGIYWAIATNQNGCVASDTVNVTISGTAPQVDFSTSTRCAGDTILFTPNVNQSITSYLWQFGGGVTSNLVSPEFVFQNPGPQWVTLKVTAQGGCTGQKTKVLNILSQPNADFSFTQDPCMFDTTFFFDQSQMPGGNVIQWLWNFGDPGSGPANISTQPNPNHVFSDAGIYPVKLTSFNDSLCKKSVTIPVYVNPAAIPEFLFDKTCIGEPVKFTNQSTAPPGVAILGYQWNFGNGQFSSLPNPQQTYSQGIYNVSLRVNSIANNKICKAFRVKTLNINKDITAAFNIPDSICAGQNFLLTDTGTSVNDVVSIRKWRISDIGVLNGQNINYAFPNTVSGWRTIRLIAQTAGGCMDSTQQTIYVKPSPQLDFNISPLGGPAPLNISFINNSDPVNSYSWFLNNSLFFTGYQPGDTLLATPGSYNIILASNAPNGCADSLYKTIVLDPPGIGLQFFRLNCEIEGDYLNFSVTLLNGGSTPVTEAHLLAGAAQQSFFKYFWDGNLLPGDSASFTLNTLIRFTELPKFCCVKIENYNQSIQLPETLSSLCIPLEYGFWIGDIFPNPVSENQFSLYIHIPFQDKVLVRISQINGKVLWTSDWQALDPGLHNLNFTLPELSSGPYLLSIEYKDKRLNKMFLKLDVN